MAVRRTNSEVRATHRTLIAAGLLLAAAGASLDFVPVLADLMPFGAAAQMGYTLALLLIGGVLAAPLGAFMAKRIPTKVMLVMVGIVLTVTSTYGFIRAVLM